MPGSNLSYVAATPLPTAVWGAGDAPLPSDWVGSTAGFKMPNDRIVQMISDGTRWRPIGPFVVLQPNASVTGTTAETTLASVTIPANLLGADGSVRVYALYSFTGTAGIKYLRIKFNGNTFVSLAPSAPVLSTSVLRQFSNLTTGTQVSSAVGLAAEGATNSNPITTLFVDTTADTTLTVTAQLAVGTDTASLAKVIVEIL